MFSFTGENFTTLSVFLYVFRSRQIQSAYHFYGNFGEKFLSNGAGIFFGTENRNGIELYHLQNTGNFFAFSRLEAWQW